MAKRVVLELGLQHHLCLQSGSTADQSRAVFLTKISFNILQTFRKPFPNIPALSFRASSEENAERRKEHGEIKAGKSE
ncbi:hypothetical protein [Eubacterium sp. ER2]|uniref:hypothetical protein n=1 Tax=Eubacterium sp. ER2 TaxID=1519438 RepID=UPI0011CB623E|nr:hypothetical protein [Eubacterium sp. ER2]